MWCEPETNVYNVYQKMKLLSLSNASQPLINMIDWLVVV
jgi:hypothetical protein